MSLAAELDFASSNPPEPEPSQSPEVEEAPSVAEKEPEQPVRWILLYSAALLHMWMLIGARKQQILPPMRSISTHEAFLGVFCPCESGVGTQGGLRLQLDTCV